MELNTGEPLMSSITTLPFFSKILYLSLALDIVTDAELPNRTYKELEYTVDHIPIPDLTTPNKALSADVVAVLMYDISMTSSSCTT